MLLEAIYHQPKRNWAYAYDQDTDPSAPACQKE